jgi:hypothetical protein
MYQQQQQWVAELAHPCLWSLNALSSTFFQIIIIIMVASPREK